MASLTITYDPKNDFSVLTDEDERVCLPYVLNNLPLPIRHERRDAQGFWKFVQNMTGVQFEAWCNETDSNGNPRIPKIT